MLLAEVALVRSAQVSHHQLGWKHFHFQVAWHIPCSVSSHFHATMWFSADFELFDLASVPWAMLALLLHTL